MRRFFAEEVEEAESRRGLAFKSYGEARRPWLGRNLWSASSPEDYIE